jgi:hypothetical protein
MVGIHPHPAALAWFEFGFSADMARSRSLSTRGWSHHRQPEAQNRQEFLASSLAEQRRRSAANGHDSMHLVFDDDDDVNDGDADDDRREDGLPNLKKYQ